MALVNPCTGCHRVAEPEKCENKNCRPWREWYSASWEQTRLRLLGVNDADPCGNCICPRALCIVPCRAKAAWEARR